MANNKNLTQLLTKRDLLMLLELINGSLYCTHVEDLKKLMMDLKKILPYDFAICGLAHIGNDGNFTSYKAINVNYPTEWLEIYLSKKYNLCDPVFKTNFTRLGIQKWSETYKLTPPPRKFLTEAHDFDLVDGYTFGIKSQTANAKSLFSLSGKSIESHERSSAILENVMPYFNQALLRVAQGQEKKEKITSAIISAREKEVLIWLKDGKTSWDISKILSISERTVNYHVGNIMKKLDAVSRMHAVAKAACLKLIDLD